jgi:formylglycine-generating enzyme
LKASWRNPFPNLKEYRADDRHPVVHVSWSDAQAFAEHFGFQLPSEAQWEYAARAGTQTRFSWGETEAEAQGFGNFKDASGKKRFADWGLFFPFDDSSVLLAPAAKYRPNAWGIYDTQGNISEWTADVYEKYPTKEADESAVTGEENAPRVLRGGSWLDAPDFNRSAKRMTFPPNARRDFIGFRVAVGVK